MTTKERKNETAKRKTLWELCAAFNRAVSDRYARKNSRRYAKELFIRLAEYGFLMGRDFDMITGGLLMPNMGIQQSKKNK